MRDSRCLLPVLISILIAPLTLWAADGVLDTSFHSPDGYVLWDGGSGYDRGKDIALQDDGKIVVTGYMTNGSDNDLMVLRYDPNGILDTGFGTNGVYIYDSGNGSDGGYAIAVQSDDKILVAGDSSNGSDGDVIVLRLNTDGTLDPNFGSNGIFTFDSGSGGDAAIDLLVQSDGKIVMCGSCSNGTDNDLLVIRLNANGAPDTTFGTDGVAVYDGGNRHDSGSCLAVQNDGKILVAGNSHNGSDNDILVARFSINGTLDTSFGTNGIVLYDGGDHDRGSGIGTDSHANILVTGVRAQPDANSTDYDIPVIRFDPNGLLDTSFGINGIALFDGGTHEECFDLVVQSDDTILITGHSGISVGSVSDWGLVVLKYDPNGTLDTTFGTHGIYQYDPTDNTERGYGLALQTDGKIVVTGQVYNGTDDDVIVLRLTNSAGDHSEPNEPNVPGDPNETLTVTFADANLKAAVEATLGVTDPTRAQMACLDQLNAMSLGITSIKGLEYATGLYSLDVRRNKIADISPLAGLTKLVWLGIYGNLITDLTPLSNLVNLDEVDPGANQVSDITPLANLTKLRYLDITDNKIVDLSALSGLTNLRQLYLSGNQIVDISPLSGLTSLTTLDVGRNKVTDVNVLSGLVNLEHLYLHGNQIADINAVTNLTGLSALWLEGDPLNTAAYCTDLAAIYAHDPNMNLLYSPNQEAPADVSATDGTYLDKVQVTWNAVCNGPLYVSYYRVARSDSASGAKSIMSSWQSGTSFDDTTASPGVTYYYWVQAATSGDGEDATSYSVSDTGYVGGTEPPQQVGTITGRVWNDANGDANSMGEPGLPGWTVYAEPDDAANGQWDANEPSAVTDANGAYTLASLTPGTYLVREVLQAGWEQTYPEEGHHRAEVEAGQTSKDIDFGNWQPTSEPNEPGEPARHVLWSQPPIEIEPSLDPNVPPVFCAWDEASRSLQEPGHRRTWQMVLDDFRCLGPIPITRLRWWGSFEAWDGPEIPAHRPLAWHVAFWMNGPDDIDDALFPQRMVWAVEIPFERVELHPAGIGEFPYSPAEMCFVHDVVLDPEEWFLQGEVPADQGVLWISIAAIYPEGEANGHLWGWTTRPSPALEPAQVVTLYDEGPTPETELRLDQLTPVLRDQPCNTVHAFDMAFELLTEGPWVQWDQPSVPPREWPWSADEVSVLVEQLEGIGPLIDREVADDWLCARPDPIVAIAWNGSYPGYGYEACGCNEVPRPRGPDAFLLSVYENAPPDTTAPYGHPREKVWEYLAWDYDEVMVGYGPNSAGEPNQAVWKYSVRLPEDQWFRAPVADRVYWLSVVAVYLDWPAKASHLWSWTHHGHDFGTGANWIDFSPHLSLMPMWRVLRDPLDRPVDMAFTLFTVPQAPGPEPLAHWPLDEAEGEIAHDVVGGRHGIVRGGTWTEGIHGGALGLDGLNDYVDCGGDPVLGPELMTLALWIRPEPITTARYVVSRAHGTDDLTDYALLIMQSGSVEFVFDARGAGAGSVLSTTRAALGEWAHVAATRSQTLGVLYLNGRQEASKSYGSRSAGEGFTLTLGSYRGQMRFFNGTMDDVRLYDVPLTQSWISALAGL